MITKQKKDEISKTIRLTKPPYPGLDIPLVEYPSHSENLPLLALILKRSNLLKFSKEQRASILEYAYAMAKVVESFGVRCKVRYVDDVE